MKKVALLEGDVFQTKSGRVTTPFPRTNYKIASKNIKAVNQWLKENALDEAKENMDGYMETIIKGLNPENWSPADSSQVNLYLFGNAEGEIGNLKVS